MTIRHLSFADLPPTVAGAGAAAALDRLPSTGSGISDDPTVGRSLLVAFKSGLEMPRTNNRSQTGDAELDFFFSFLPYLHYQAGKPVSCVAPYHRRAVGYTLFYVYGI